MPKKPAPKTKRKAADANAELRAMLERLQDPEYVMQVIKRCQEHGLIPKDATCDHSMAISEGDPVPPSCRQCQNAAD